MKTRIIAAVALLPLLLLIVLAAPKFCTGILFGLITAAVGVRDTVKAMALIDKKGKDKDENPPVSFNDHD